MIVVDASVVVNMLLDDGDDGRRSRERLAAEASQHAPGLLDVEVVSALRRSLGRGLSTEHVAGEAVADLADLRIQRYPHRALLPRIWELRHNLTPYDAAYVALAEVLGAPLVTADAKLAGASGLRCNVEVLA